MKRRLTNAYDTMTMPESCSQRIEEKLLEQMQQKKDRYTRAITPGSSPRRGWVAGMVVCLMLVLSVGGSLLFLYSSEMRLEQPENLNPSLAEPTVVSAATPEDHYAMVTNFSAEEVESFAKVVRSNMLNANWGALEGKISFPLTVQDKEFQNAREFVDWIDAFFMYSASRYKLEQESCEAMFCNWQGICMADGFIWINEVGGELKITAMNMGIQPITVTDTPVKEVPDAFADVLSGKAVYFYGGNYGPRTLEEYCAGQWSGATLDRFAVVDMDGDGICEVVISMQTAEGKNRDHLVLRQDGKYICGYRFRSGEMIDLKKDGSFFHRDRDHRMYFNDEESCVTTEVQEQVEKPLAQWHAYPCIRPELVLRSYEYVTGTGWSSFPGMPYSYFESLVLQRAENQWETLEPWLSKAGYIEEEEDTVYLLDPDAPGTVMFGTLTDENGYTRFSSIGYYISNEYGELQGEVRDIHTDSPEYWMGTHLELLDSHGRQTQSPDEFIAYFGYTPMPDQRTLQERASIRRLIDDFAAVCVSGDPRAMESYLTEDCEGWMEGMPEGGLLKVVTYGQLYNLSAEIGKTCSASASLRSDEGKSYWLNLELLKQKDGWKIQSFNLWKNEE